jgi:hypothetical protein
MRAQEFITELKYFLGSPCTKDCSGHQAGYNWGKQNNQQAATPSPSFNNGTQIAKNYKERPQGGGKVAGQLSQNPNAIRKRERRLQNIQPQI